MLKVTVFNKDDFFEEGKKELLPGEHLLNRNFDNDELSSMIIEY